MPKKPWFLNQDQRINNEQISFTNNLSLIGVKGKPHTEATRKEVFEKFTELRAALAPNGSPLYENEAKITPVLYRYFNKQFEDKILLRKIPLSTINGWVSKWFKSNPLDEITYQKKLKEKGKRNNYNKGSFRKFWELQSVPPNKTNLSQEHVLERSEDLNRPVIDLTTEEPEQSEQELTMNKVLTEELSLTNKLVPTEESPLTMEEVISWLQP